ncbi:hypothetical protein CJ030_MR5G001756 [Morella rubra]|uniref:Uncharacterized protein n=1 Tax=Morella rubra TaxID=262757 RepID=A0A6A1VH26_9ROSI|nr:hypothetical protein CJ030_MR5G001759 [Morella rubra]KAB1212162.1 hypothetical protein CJ030_MR5G001756 [Morella rubra]
MAIQAKTPCVHLCPPFHSALPGTPYLLGGPLRLTASLPRRRKSLKLSCESNGNDSEQDYLIDAPVSVGDGFSFYGGKYSDGPSPSDEWFKQGKIVRTRHALGSDEKAKDPIFGLRMGAGSQTSADSFRWFCVESGSADKPPVLLIHGFPSQAYSYRKVLPILSKDYHAIAFDWLVMANPSFMPVCTTTDIAALRSAMIKSRVSPYHICFGFGFSDKPQPGYGFDYTLDEYVSSLDSLINELATSKISLVVQGYFSPVVVKYAISHQEKLNDLILINSPLTAKHANLPSTLSIFSNFLLGEIFSQDPLRASDKALTSCGPYKMKEDDAMVYRRPYLTSGSSGFALNAISRAMKKELKTYVEDMRKILMDKDWKVPTTIFWGQRDRWLSYDGVEDFCKDSKHKLIELPMVLNVISYTFAWIGRKLT